MQLLKHGKVLIKLNMFNQEYYMYETNVTSGGQILHRNGGSGEEATLL